MPIRPDSIIRCLNSTYNAIAPATAIPTTTTLLMVILTAAAAPFLVSSVASGAAEAAVVVTEAAEVEVEEGAAEVLETVLVMRAVP